MFTVSLVDFVLSYLLKILYYDDLVYVCEDTKLYREKCSCLYVFCCKEGIVTVWMKAF